MTTLAAPATRLFTRPFALACAAAFVNLTAFYLPLSVVPARVVAAGAPDGAAGLVTAALMLGGVLAECVAPRLMNRFGDRAVLAGGLVLVGGASLLLVPAVDVASAVLVCGLRGVGFGFAVVVTGALSARLVPTGRRGEGLAVAGVVACVPAVAALPAGVWLADVWGAGAVFVVAAAVAVAGVVAPLALGSGLEPAEGLPQPSVTAAAGAEELGRRPAAAEQPAGLVAVARTPAQRRPALLFAATTVAGGIVVAYLPLATSGPAVAFGLFVQALAATAGRYGAGRWGDRHGHARLVGPGLAVSGVGMVLLLGVDRPAVLLAAMAVFGIGFGIMQSATYAVMVERAPAAGHGAVSALWNLAYDLGYGVGPLAFAAVVGTSGYPVAFALTGLVVLAGLRSARRIR
jgi:MFS family permease